MKKYFTAIALHTVSVQRFNHSEPCPADPVWMTKGTIFSEREGYEVVNTSPDGTMVIVRDGRYNYYLLKSDFQFSWEPLYRSIAITLLTARLSMLSFIREVISSRGDTTEMLKLENGVRVDDGHNPPEYVEYIYIAGEVIMFVLHRNLEETKKISEGDIDNILLLDIVESLEKQLDK